MSRGSYATGLLQSAATATGNGTTMPVAGIETVVVQLTGTFSATVTWEGTVDESNWSAVRATDLSAGTDASTATAAGLYRIDTRGLLRIRARISAYTSGSVTARALGHVG